MLNARQFVTAARLATYGADLEFYDKHWLTIYDLTELMIEADVRNSIELGTWTAIAGISTTNPGYDNLDKPKKALLYSLETIKANFGNNVASNPAFNLKTSDFNTLSFSAFDLVFYKIDLAMAIRVKAYLTHVTDAELMVGGKDAYIPGTQGVSINVAKKAMLLYKLSQPPIPTIYGYDQFTSKLFDFEEVGINKATIEYDIANNVL